MMPLEMKKTSAEERAEQKRRVDQAVQRVADAWSKNPDFGKIADLASSRSPSVLMGIEEELKDTGCSLKDLLLAQNISAE
jgi:hypothetical protein